MSGWWTEWQTYALSDFLMFSAQTYFRQFELLNRELWPGQLAALGAGLALAACMRARQRTAPVAFGLLAIAWAAVGWIYHAGRYADIHIGAPHFAAGFGVQALLLAWMARRSPPLAGTKLAPAVIMAVALLAYPLLAPLNGRSLWQAEVFALAPDPTVAASFGVLLAWRAPWPLWVLPLLWSALTGATLMELHAPQAWLLPSVALLASALALRQARQDARS